VRTAPNTSGKKLGVAHEGDRLPYGGETSENGWNLVEYKGKNGWVSGKYSKLIDGGGTARGAKIVDLSHHKTVLDYDALVRDTALIILRAGVRKTDGRIYEDDKFEAQAAALAARGVRFGVFFYSMAATADQAREEARAFIQYAKDKKPLFWALDAERPEIDYWAITAFAEELRALGAERVGCYVAHHRYREYNFDGVRGLFDFIWIPNYIAKPSWPCDLWQYTDEGSVGGINSNVDLNRITGEGHDLSWFTGG
jgi:GH25 family lysozyme M1 (1,4-beta-N-acetylmuramidase)